MTSRETETHLRYSRTESVNQARENFVRGSRDTDSDLSIEDYTSSEEASDSDASLTDEDRPIVIPLLKTGLIT